MAFAPFRHAGLKALAIALAVTLWVLVSGNEMVERALRIPLEFTNLPEQLEMVGDPPNVVDVRVRGSSGALARITAGELVAVLDIEGAREGQRLFHLRNLDVRAPVGVQVMQVTPSNVSIRFEPSVTKVVPVVASIEGNPKTGFVVTRVLADPAQVELVGPASEIQAATEAITEPVSVSGADRTVSDIVTVGSPDPAIRLRTPQNARVTALIAEAPAAWQVTGVRIQVHSATRSVEITPARVSLDVRGPESARHVATDAFDAFIDVSGLRAGRYDLPVRVVPPAGIGVVRVDPSIVRVRIR